MLGPLSLCHWAGFPCAVQGAGGSVVQRRALAAWRGQPWLGPWPLCTENLPTSLTFSEQNLERQVLQTQCRRLEAQHYSLSLTAEQLSHSMAVSLGSHPPRKGIQISCGGGGLKTPHALFNVEVCVHHPYR